MQIPFKVVLLEVNLLDEYIYHIGEQLISRDLIFVRATKWMCLLIIIISDVNMENWEGEIWEVRVSFDRWIDEVTLIADESVHVPSKSILLLHAFICFSEICWILTLRANLAERNQRFIFRKKSNCFADLYFIQLWLLHALDLLSKIAN